jgi:hypothetical protein
VKDIPRKPGFYRDAKLRESYENWDRKSNHYQHLNYRAGEVFSGVNTTGFMVKHLVSGPAPGLVLHHIKVFSEVSRETFLTIKNS